MGAGFMNTTLHPIFRDSQYDLMQYKGGCVAVHAAPGSGKTWLLAQLAAANVTKLTKRDLDTGREILVVTFSNSAAATLNNQIQETLQTQYGHTSFAGLRVRTLHALAHEIIAETPETFGLSPDFRIIEERIAYHIRRAAVLENLPDHPELSHLFNPVLIPQSSRLEALKRDYWPQLLHRTAERFIHSCKNYWLPPSDSRLTQFAQSQPLIQFLLTVYRDYQSSLDAEQAVDYDDLIVMVCAALKHDLKLLRKLQMRWRICLEDEAQDSSSAQAVMLRLMTGAKNWVRVGDSNQAINTSFTTADPGSFRDFFTEPGVKLIRLNQSGRSSRPILSLANTLLKWTRFYHPNLALRSAFDDMQIEPTHLGDPDPTPPTNDTNIHIHLTDHHEVAPDQAQKMVISSLLRWLPNHPDQTVAILAPENRQGYAVSAALESAGIPFDERLQIPLRARYTLSALRAALHYLANPLDSNCLATLYQQTWPKDIEQQTHSREVARRLSRFRDPEVLLYPSDQQDPLYEHFKSFGTSIINNLQSFRSAVQRWLKTDHLPIELRLWQIAHDIYSDDENILVVEEIARFVHAFQRRQPQSGIQEIVNELDTITARNARFLRAADTAPFKPRPGIPTIATLHAAKGLEWDRVYILGINNRAFPSVDAEDVFVSDHWFIRDQMNLEAEARSAVQAIADGLEFSVGNATAQAHLEFSAERLRLLYVGITRARCELVLLWDTGLSWRTNGKPAKPALPLIALHEYLEGTLYLE